LTDSDWEDDADWPGPGSRDDADIPDDEWQQYPGYHLFRWLIAMATLGAVLGLIGLLSYLVF
jgi:hypothetical protein